MRNEVETVKALLAQVPPNWDAAERIISANKFTEEELAYLSIAVSEDCSIECKYVAYENKNAEFEKIHSTYLIRTLKMLLKNGMNPNYIYDKQNVMWNINYIDLEYVGAEALRLLLEHGGNPMLDDPEGDGESLFDYISSLVAFDEYTHEFEFTVNCMFILLGFGAHWSNGTIPFKMLDDNDVSIFKNIGQLFYEIEGLPNQGYMYTGKWKMHVYKKETNLEVAVWD